MSITAFGHALETLHDELTILDDGAAAPMPLLQTQIAVDIHAGLATIRTSRHFRNAPTNAGTSSGSRIFGSVRGERTSAPVPTRRPPDRRVDHPFGPARPGSSSTATSCPNNTDMRALLT